MSDTNTFKPVVGMKLFIGEHSSNINGSYYEVVVRKVGNKFFYVDKTENNNGQAYCNNIKCEVNNNVSFEGSVARTLHAMSNSMIYEDLNVYKKYIGWKNLKSKIKNGDLLEILPEDVKKQIFDLCVPFVK